MQLSQKTQKSNSPSRIPMYNPQDNVSLDPNPQPFFPDSGELEETTVNFEGIDMSPNQNTQHQQQQPPARNPNVMIPPPATQNMSSTPNQPNFNIFNEFGSAMNMDGFTQTALSNVGMQVIGQGSEAFTSKYVKSFSTLKYFFNVNNSYVINKLKILLFPFRQKTWKRRIYKDGQREGALPPREDINAPDFYIPTMSFVTWVCIIGLIFGTSNQFTPEVLGMIASSGLVGLTIEIVLIKFCFYLFTSTGIGILDLIAYCGYKYVGIALSSLLGFFFGSYASYSTLFLTSFFHSLFLVKTLNAEFEGDNDIQVSPTLKYLTLLIGFENILHCAIISYRFG